MNKVDFIKTFWNIYENKGHNEALSWLETNNYIDIFYNNDNEINLLSNKLKKLNTKI